MGIPILREMSAAEAGTRSSSTILTWKELPLIVTFPLSPSWTLYRAAVSLFMRILVSLLCDDRISEGLTVAP